MPGALAMSAAPSGVADIKADIGARCRSARLMEVPPNQGSVPSRRANSDMHNVAWGRLAATTASSAVPPCIGTTRRCQTIWIMQG